MKVLVVGGGGRELRNGVRLNVVRPFERAQVPEELLLVARREQRGDEDDVRDAGRQRGKRRVARVDEDQLRADLLLDDALEDAGLTQVRLDREYERQRS